MAYNIRSAIQQKPLLILFCVWLAVQLSLLLSLGIVTNNEALKYNGEAHNLLLYGQYSEPKYIFYSAYIFLHILFIKLGFETVGVYLTQLLVNLLAMYLLYKTAINLVKKKETAFLTVVLLLICYSWQYWTVFLYTESFFCSLIIIITYLLCGQHKKTSAQKTLASVIFILIIFARPTGMFIIPVLCFMLLHYLFEKKQFAKAMLSGLLMAAVFIIILNYAMQGGSSFDFMKPLIENNVLCYIPEQTTSAQTVFHTSGNPLQDVWVYIAQNPAQFLKPAGLKFLSYWGMTRPYYSSFHNTWLMCFFYPLYFFAAVGIWKLGREQKYFVMFAAGMFIIFSLSVMVTCDDWNNRFNMPIIPLLMLPAAVGIYTMYKKLRGNKTL